MKYIDLHVHSCKSDGTFTPSELVYLAKDHGLSAFALTDHDTVDGVKEAVTTGKKLGIEVVPGIELSTDYNGGDVHILGYYPNTEDPAFLAALAEFQDIRENRNKKMVDKLNTFGLHITMEEMQNEAGDSVITRAHMARALLRHGYIKTMSEAFSKYIGDDCPCYVSREKITPVDAVKFLKKYHAVPVLAHPLLYHLSEKELETLVLSLKDAGLLGIEAVYSRNTGFDESNMRRLARKNNLIITGGSDFHGSNKPDIDLGRGVGNLHIPYEFLENIVTVQP